MRTKPDDKHLQSAQPPTATSLQSGTAGRDHCRQTIRPCALFDGMTAEAIENLTAAATIRLCDEGEAVYGSEDLGETLYLIASGIAAVGLTAPDQDKRIVFDWAGPGEAVGALEILGNGEKPRRITDMFALTRLSAVTIPGSAIRAPWSGRAIHWRRSWRRWPPGGSGA